MILKHCSLAFVICCLFGLAAQAAHVVTVTRGEGTQGTVTYTEDEEEVFSTQCWWAEDKRIPAGEYGGCSFTRGASDKWDGVFMPNVPGFDGIFLHQGGSPNDSDGCIVFPDEFIQQIGERTGRDGQNITVIVTDE